MIEKIILIINKEIDLINDSLYDDFENKIVIQISYFLIWYEKNFQKISHRDSVIIYFAILLNWLSIYWYAFGRNIYSNYS